MRITAVFLIALSYAQANFKVPEFLVKTNISMQSRQTIQNKVAVKLSPRDDQLIQLGRLNGLDLTKSDWVHKQVEICSEFPKHVFVQYQEKGEPNETFIAIYPRGGGRIQIVRQGNGPSPASRFSSTRASTISVFNAILANERRAPSLKGATSDLDWIRLGTCYAELAGEIPAVSADVSNIYNGDDLKHSNIEHRRISIVGIQVVGESGAMADLSIEFSKPGFIRRVTRTESDKLSHTQ